MNSARSAQLDLRSSKPTHCFRLSVILRRPLGLTNENDKESDVESPRAHFFETDLASSVQRIDRLRRKVERNIVV